MSVRAVLLFTVAVAFSACASHGAKTASSLDDIDTFGSSRISAAEMKKEYGQRIDDWAALPVNEDYFRAQKKIEQSIKDKYHFAFVQLSLVTYFDPKPGRYLNIDVVEPADAPARMIFAPAPTKQGQDPAGLISAWTQYEAIAHELQVAGTFSYPKQCPAWHCAWGFEDPKLAPFLATFQKDVPANEMQLVQILKQDARPTYRANAAFLLAHTKDGEKLISYLLPATKDSSFLVRNNAVRVLAEMADKHPELTIPVAPILQVLNSPTTTDRNKAGAVLFALSKKPENRQDIIQGGGSVLLQMLKLRQPNNHDFAYLTLQNLCSAHFGERNYAAWESCLR